jgi:D-alanine-D-alanine ligase
LVGGDSAEREVSLRTGEQVMAALSVARYDAFVVDALALRGIDGAQALWERRPDVVFIALHGPHGEDGSVQGLLDLLGLPYTGSGVLASALAMDKAMCKRVLRGEGIPTPWSLAVTSVPECPEELPVPLVAKPNAQGSSFGMSIIHAHREVAAAVDLALQFDSVCLLEEFITGTEITVSVLGNGDAVALPVIEIIPKAEFYDFDSKYQAGGSTHIIPARISDAAAAKAREYALRCHSALGCRGMSRTDMIVNGDDAVVLEVNTIPGMTPTSLLPDAARAAGISFSEVLDRLIASALAGHTTDN